MNDRGRAEAEVPLHVEIQGEGEALLLMHGFGGSARNFRPQVRALRDRFRVVCFDARGHARSGAPADPEAYRPECFVADVGRVLDRAGARCAVVGGLSMGAGVALRFALAHRERVRGLVLASFPPGARAERGFASLAARFAEAIEREGLEAAGERFAWGPDAGLDPEAARWVRAGFLEHPPHGLAGVLRGLLAQQPAVAEFAPALAGFELPALVLAGSRDRTSLQAIRELAGLLPGAVLEVIEGAGHVVNLAAPEAFTAALLRFLSTLPPARV
jgi:2-succinyl-6-hydroxy-2,4-cyclohexadiene-1-carboxylate synthase